MTTSPDETTEIAPKYLRTSKVADTGKFINETFVKRYLKIVQKPHTLPSKSQNRPTNSIKTFLRVTRTV